MVDKNPGGGRRPVRPETVVTTPVARSAEAGGDEGRRSADKEELGMPVFDGIEEPNVEIVVWTTEREEALKQITEDMMADEDELSPKVLDVNRQRYKEMKSSLALIDATEEEYRKAKCMRQPYSEMTRPFDRSGGLLR